jgi:hypothetical protein
MVYGKKRPRTSYAQRKYKSRKLKGPSLKFDPYKKYGNAPAATDRLKLIHGASDKYIDKVQRVSGASQSYSLGQNWQHPNWHTDESPVFITDSNHLYRTVKEYTPREVAREAARATGVYEPVYKPAARSSLAWSRRNKPSKLKPSRKTAVAFGAVFKDMMTKKEVMLRSKRVQQRMRAPIDTKPTKLVSTIKKFTTDGKRISGDDVRRLGWMMEKAGTYGSYIMSAATPLLTAGAVHGMGVARAFLPRGAGQAVAAAAGLLPGVANLFGSVPAAALREAGRTLQIPENAEAVAKERRKNGFLAMMDKLHGFVVSLATPRGYQALPAPSGNALPPPNNVLAAP